MKGGCIKLIAPPGKRPDLLIIAGEHSGDEHAAAAVRGLLDRRPELKVCSLGGPRTLEAGAHQVYDMTQAAIVGLVEVARNFRYLRELFHAVLAWIDTHRPRAVCFVDYPGFNLRMAKALFDRGLASRSGGPVRLLYYISPQVWAWKAKRRFAMAGYLDALAVIFPFEVQVFEDTSLPVEFVGHPFLAPDYELPLEYDPAGPVLLLPGSRGIAVSRIFPPLVDTYLRLLKKRPAREAVVVYPDESIRQILEKQLALVGSDASKIRLAPRGASIAAAAALTSSGTMSLTCALAGIPGAIVYRANWLTCLAGRAILRVPFLGIANLLLEHAMYPEFIQGDARPDLLTSELQACLEDPARMEQTRDDARRLREILSAPARHSIPEWLAKKLG